MSKTKEWTVMFYFASDNPLAPSIVSQLKAIKEAGYHPEANVLAQFDPHTVNTPAHIFDVNMVPKLKDPGKAQIGFRANDPYVRNLVLDKLWDDFDEDIRSRIAQYLKENHRAGGQRSALRPNSYILAPTRNGTELGSANVAERVDAAEQQEVPVEYDPPVPLRELSSEPAPREALTNFLDFCRRNYPARHYLLVILGHGIVVGNDLFLHDEHANEHSLTLSALGSILVDFKNDIEHAEEPGELELIGFHSCSMSGVEVAYELEGTANYMLASQGPAFVGSWPYRQILINLFNDLGSEQPYRSVTVDEMLSKMFYYVLYNAYDFQLAGYSYDSALCDLRKVSDLTAPLRKLASELCGGLEDATREPEADPLVKDLILLAHWDAQSYWQENYTDLYDFCFRLSRRCESAKPASNSTSTRVEAIITECQKIMEALKRRTDYARDGLISRSGFAGPEYQYSHGLSIYFPWSTPVESKMWDDEYETYKVNEKTSWRKFLETYFRETMRLPHDAELDPNCQPQPTNFEGSLLDDGLLRDVTGAVFNREGQLAKSGPEDRTGPPKSGPNDPTGDECYCSSIKNYPSFTQPREKKDPEKPEGEGAFPMSPDFVRTFDLAE